MNEEFADRHPWLTVTTVSVGTLAVVLVIVLIGWAAGGWFQVQNAKRQIKIQNINAVGTRHGYEYQQSLRESITQEITGVLQIGPQMVGQPTAEVQALQSQRLAQLRQVCQDATGILGDPLPGDQQQFVKTNCLDGDVNPSSPYQKAVPNP